MIHLSVSWIGRSSESAFHRSHHDGLVPNHVDRRRSTDRPRRARLTPRHARSAQVAGPVAAPPRRSDDNGSGQRPIPAEQGCAGVGGGVVDHPFVPAELLAEPEPDRTPVAVPQAEERVQQVPPQLRHLQGGHRGHLGPTRHHLRRHVDPLIPSNSRSSTMSHSWPRKV